MKSLLLASATLFLISPLVALAQDYDMGTSKSVSSTTSITSTTTTSSISNIHNPNYYEPDDYYHNNPNHLDRALITKNDLADSYYNRYTYDKPHSRAQVKEELVTWERAGYNPNTRDPYYPHDVHMAQLKITAWQAKYGVAGEKYRVAQAPQPAQ